MDRIIKKLDHGWWIVNHKQKLQLPEGELPYGEVTNFDLVGQRVPQIGERQGEPVWLVQQQRCHDTGSVRQVIDLDVGLFQLAGRGVQLAEFHRSHKYCGHCGYKTYPSKTERATLCGHCRERYYPQIALYIVVAIRRDGSAFLAQHAHHCNGVHATPAGFVEVDETLKQAVAREMMEESGIKVKSLRYVTSQPRSFPQPSMTVFMAKYDSNDIVIDPRELFKANWCRCGDLPSLPPSGTVTHRLIEDTAAMCRTGYEWWHTDRLTH